MMNFLKTIFAVIIGVFVASWVMLFGFIAVMSVMSFQDKEKIADNSLLVLRFDDEYVDYAAKTTFGGDFSIEDQDNNGIDQVVNAIKHAQTDVKIRGISLKETTGIQGIAHLKEIRAALEDFKKSGKFIYAFNENISQADYYLQSVADSLFLGTMGVVDLRGLSTQLLYFKDFQDKFGIKMEVVRHGKYKNAVEPFLLNKMSDENKEQIQAFLNSTWKNIAQTIADARSIPLEKLNVITENFQGRTSEGALAEGLVDGLLFYDQYKEKLVQALGVKSTNDIKTVGIKQYINHISRNKKLEKNTSKAQIAIVHVEGTIMEGKAMEGTAGSESICAALEKVRNDQNVKAVVLRVNSPGGSGSASEFIHREIELTKKVKPVYTSMGNYAASGGYYVACNSERIFAEKETITGSIGVFGLLPNYSEFVQKIGVQFQEVKTHKHSVFYSPLKPMTLDGKEVLTEQIDNFYKKFVTRVSQGRNRSFAQIDSLAQGRIWTGEDAQKIGLVDTIGSLNDAVAYAAQKAQLQDYTTEHYPVFEFNIKQFFKQKMPLSTLQEELLLGQDIIEVLNQIKVAEKQKGVWAKLPFEVLY